MSVLTNYYVEIDFLHKPTYRRSNVIASSPAQAILITHDRAPISGSKMYRNATSTAITMDKRNQMIRDWHKEEAEAGNI